MTDEDGSISVGLIHAYVHPGSRLAAMVEVSCNRREAADDPVVRGAVHDLAMHVAAVAPIYRSREEVPAGEIENELVFYRAEADRKGLVSKAEREEFLQQRMVRFYAQVCLLEQPFIKDMTRTIRDVLAEWSRWGGGEIVVRRFVRFQIGETERDRSDRRYHGGRSAV